MEQTLEEAVAHLQTLLPAAQLSLYDFHAGGFMLDVFLGDEFYVLEHVSAQGYGVSRVTEDNGFMRGSDAAFTSFTEAEQYLVERLTEQN